MPFLPYFLTGSKKIIANINASPVITVIRLTSILTPVIVAPIRPPTHVVTTIPIVPIVPIVVDMTTLPVITCVMVVLVVTS